MLGTLALCTVIANSVHPCNIWAFVITGSVQRYAGRVQSGCSQSPGFVQQHVEKSDISVEVSFPVSKKTQTLPLACTTWRDGLGVDGLGSARHSK